MPLYGLDVRKSIKIYYTDMDITRQMPLKMINTLALKLLECIEEIHSLGYIHCDIKPENFVYASSEENTGDIILIDFGMVHRYTDPKNGIKHIQYGNAYDFKGTPSFSSL